IRALLDERGIDGERARRAVVDTDLRVGMMTGLDDDGRANKVGDGDALGALDENRIDVAAGKGGYLMPVGVPSCQPVQARIALVRDDRFLDRDIDQRDGFD